MARSQVCRDVCVACAVPLYEPGTKSPAVLLTLFCSVCMMQRAVKHLATLHSGLPFRRRPWSQASILLASPLARSTKTLNSQQLGTRTYVHFHARTVLNCFDSLVGAKLAVHTGALSWNTYAYQVWWLRSVYMAVVCSMCRTSQRYRIRPSVAEHLAWKRSRPLRCQQRGLDAG